MASSLSMAQLTAWYDSAKPRRQNILGDFAGRELCVIHGESLLLHCLETSKVDFQDGFQMLHAVHAVESFLGKFRDRGCHFHVIWFDDHANLLDLNYGQTDEDASAAEKKLPETAFLKRLLAREVILQHLQRFSDSESPGNPFCFAFPSMDSDEYRAYIDQNAIRLFFVSDGLLSSQVASGFLRIIFSISIRGYATALVDDVVFRSSEICATLFMATLGFGFHNYWPTMRCLPENSKAADNLSTSFHSIVKNMPKTRHLSLRELVALTVLSTLMQIDPQPEMKQRVASFVVQLSILRHCPLDKRPVTPEVTTKKDCQHNNQFLNLYCSMSRTLLHSQPWKETVQGLIWDVYDLVDGRIWLAVQNNSDHISCPPLLVTSIIELASVLDVVAYLPDTVRGHMTGPVSPPPYANTDAPLGSLLPFSHPDVDPLLQGVATFIDSNAESQTGQTEEKVFLDSTHWHNLKKLNDTPVLVNPLQLRRNQRYMTDIQDYAASLTNTSGGILKPEPIIVDRTAKGRAAERKTTKPNASGEGSNKASRKNPQALKGSALDRQQAALRAQKQSAEASEIRKWKAAHDNFCKETDPVKQYTSVLNYYESRPSETGRKTIGPYACTFLCKIVSRVLCKRSGILETVYPELAALIWFHLLRMRTLPLTDQYKRKDEDFKNALGFSYKQPIANLGPSSTHPSQSGADNALCDPRKEAWTTTTPISEYELEFCGPYMERGFQSQPDPRVRNFNPDAWQRTVLDGIDDRKSLFVVAPTSAGKTFISFYAMEQVLRGGDTGVLVYVAPTKALVNQVAAEIQSRFSKKYPHGGESVWAIKTRDYKINNPTGCQILVTVPHMLQILLLSPNNLTGKNPWPDRLRWIIFDEVHSIGQSEEGIVWEQLLLMAPCPIIALSATVGNPNEFMVWLDNCEKTKGREIQMIVHSSRYSELRNYFWKPSGNFKFDGLISPTRWPIPGLEKDGCNQDSPFIFIHPVSSIIDRSRDTLDDISFEPRDCLSLWRSMKIHQTDKFPLPSDLDPSTYFTSTITKADAVSWEAKVKKELLYWIHDAHSPFTAVQNDFRTAAMMDSSVDKYGAQHIIELINDLRNRAALPALIFIYDRDLCENTAWKIVEQLELAESNYKSGNSEWARKMTDFEAHQASRKREQATKVKVSRKKDKMHKEDDDYSTKEDLMKEEADKNFSKWDSFDPDAALDQFNLADRTKLTAEELKDHIERLRFANIDKTLIKALWRGVGVHHAGMNRKYRHVVEVLFRKGFLTVVIATGTLALGINMPCKTVVFAGDSTFLNSLNYRQASGRAGRRGFDILGNVVFYDFSPQQVLEVISSRLPDLRGHFPISTTLVLRTLMALHLSGRSEYSKKLVYSLFSQTRLYLGGPTGQDAIKHHMRFSIDYLRRHKLLSADGAPLNFAGLVSHLYFTENSGLAFHSLLQGGYLPELCARIYSNKTAVLEELVLVLSHIFGCVPCRRYKDEDWMKSIKRSSSVVLLRPLPAKAKALLQAYNAESLSIFKTYVANYVQQHFINQPDQDLPFTRIKVAPGEPDHSKVLGAHGFTPVMMRSPFAALSGFTDEFRSVQELCSTVRSGVFLEEASVPYIPLFPEDTDGVPFNAYIYDYFRHGDMQTLVRHNGIKNGDVWFWLQEFSLVLATIITSLRSFIDPAMGSVVDAVDDMEENLWGGNEMDSKEEQSGA